MTDNMDSTGVSLDTDALNQRESRALLVYDVVETLKWVRGNLSQAPKATFEVLCSSVALCFSSAAWKVNGPSCQTRMAKGLSSLQSSALKSRLLKFNCS
jgi:hypothetical protein